MFVAPCLPGSRNGLSIVWFRKAIRILNTFGCMRGLVRCSVTITLLHRVTYKSVLGPIVRVGPTRYSFSNPADVKVIYELGGKFFKTEFYEPLKSPEPEQQNIFAIRDPNYHKDRRRKIANLYSMSTMVSYEDAVNRMNTICMRKLTEFANEARRVSLPDFMQYYAFDVIGEITVRL